MLDCPLLRVLFLSSVFPVTDPASHSATDRRINANYVHTLAHSHTFTHYKQETVPYFSTFYCKSFAVSVWMRARTLMYHLMQKCNNETKYRTNNIPTTTTTIKKDRKQSTKMRINRHTQKNNNIHKQNTRLAQLRTHGCKLHLK